jgi:hypothetical protein
MAPYTIDISLKIETIPFYFLAIAVENPTVSPIQSETK